MSKQAIEYYNSAIKKIANDLKISNTLATPKINKIVINCGFGKDKGDKDIIDDLLKNITQISGQKPIVTLAKKSISSFKIGRASCRERV